MEKHKYRIVLITKGALDIEVAQICEEECDVENMSTDETMDMLYYGDYILNCGLGDEWSGHFSLTVYDETDNVVYETEDYNSIRFVASSDDLADYDEFASKDNLPSIIQKLEKCWAAESDTMEQGLYVAGFHEMKWLEYSFTFEDYEFDAAKLFFVSNREVEGMAYDYMTDPGHLFYGDDFLKPECCQDSEDEYGTNYSLLEKSGKGYWEEIRGI